MNTTLKVKSWIGITVALFLSIVFVSEMIGFRNNPLEYERVYHIGSEGVDWKYKSGQNFMIWNIGKFSLAVVYIVANLFYLFKFKENRAFRLTLLCVEIGLLIWVVWSLIEWYLTGFDH